MTVDWKVQARGVLESVAGTPARDYFQASTHIQHTDGVSALVTKGDLPTVLASVRTSLPAGLAAFVGNEGWGKTTAELIVVPAQDQYDILRLLGTGDPKRGVTAERVIAWLKKYEIWGLTIEYASRDVVQASLERLPDDLVTVAEDIYGIAPDVVSQGTGSFSDLEESIRETREIYLCWE